MLFFSTLLISCWFDWHCRGRFFFLFRSTTLAKYFSFFTNHSACWTKVHTKSISVQLIHGLCCVGRIFFKLEYVVNKWLNLQSISLLSFIYIGLFMSITLCRYIIYRIYIQHTLWTSVVNPWFAIYGIYLPVKILRNINGMVIVYFIAFVC